MLRRGAAKMSGDEVRRRSRHMMEAILAADARGEVAKAAVLREEMQRFGDDIVAWLNGTQQPTPPQKKVPAEILTVFDAGNLQSGKSSSSKPRR
ncbi:hypothetical protein DIPPA_22470 [Diplonema papillatum]|nr:hypothetical protein DIPPA_22470 [Diplonema papillatum]